MKISNLNNLIKTGSLQLKNWEVIDIIGEKEKVFDLLQGQVTSDIKLLLTFYIFSHLHRSVILYNLVLS